MPNQNNEANVRPRIDLLEGAVLTITSRLEAIEAWAYQRRARPFRLEWPGLAGARINNILRIRRNETNSVAQAVNLIERVRREHPPINGQERVAAAVAAENSELDLYMRQYRINQEIDRALAEIDVDDWSWCTPESWVECIPRNESPEDTRAAMNVNISVYNSRVAELCMPFVLHPTGRNRRAVFGEALRVAVVAGYGWHRNGLHRAIAMCGGLEDRARRWIFEEPAELFYEGHDCITCTTTKAVMFPRCGHLSFCVPCCRKYTDRICPFCRAPARKFKSVPIRIRPPMGSMFRSRNSFFL